MQLVFSAAVDHQVKLFECSYTASFLCVSCSNIRTERHDADQFNDVVVSCCTVLCCTIASCTVLSTVVTAALFVKLSFFPFVSLCTLITHNDDN